MVEPFILSIILHIVLLVRQEISWRQNSWYTHTPTYTHTHIHTPILTHTHDSDVQVY